MVLPEPEGAEKTNNFPLKFDIQFIICHAELVSASYYLEYLNANKVFETLQELYNTFKICSLICSNSFFI